MQIRFGSSFGYVQQLCNFIMFKSFKYVQVKNKPAHDWQLLYKQDQFLFSDTVKYRIFINKFIADNILVGCEIEIIFISQYLQCTIDHDPFYPSFEGTFKFILGKRCKYFNKSFLQNFFCIAPTFCVTKTNTKHNRCELCIQF